jgi:hypothetical protein
MIRANPVSTPAIPTLVSRDAYSRLCLAVGEHIATEHVPLVQWTAMAEPGAWRDDFWLRLHRRQVALHSDGHRVGNGGFVRSRSAAPR